MQRPRVRFDQDVVNSVHKRLALGKTHIRKPRLERKVDKAAAVIHGLQTRKAVRLDLPGVGVVLHQPALRAVDDHIFLLMPQQHPHNGRLRHIGTHPFADAAVAIPRQNGLIKARTVVVKHRANTRLHRLTAERRGVDREIAALGVPDHIQRRVRRARRDVLQIRNGERLRRDRADKAHVKILFPADERAVRAPEGDDARAVRQDECDGGKLRLRRRVQLVGVGADHQLRKPRAFAQRRDQAHIVRAQNDLRQILQRLKCPRRVRKAHPTHIAGR